MRWVHRERTVWVGALDAAEGVAAVGEGAPEEGDDGTAEADDLHGAAVARRRRRALVAGGGAGAHLVHPGAAVAAVAAVHEAGVGVDADAVVESGVAHLGVDGAAGVALAERHALKVALHRLLHHLAQWLHLDTTATTNRYHGHPKRFRFEKHRLEFRPEGAASRRRGRGARRRRRGWRALGARPGRNL